MLTQLTHRIPVVIKSLIQRKLDATEVLTRHHLKIEGLLLQLKLLSQVSRRGFANQRRDLQRRFRQTFESLNREFQEHFRMEESVFYPECEKHERIQAMIEESYDEHAEIKAMLDQMMELTLDSEAFDKKLNGLIKLVQSHVMEEEEDIFPLARRYISPARMEKMTHQMKTERKKPKKPTAAA